MAETAELTRTERALLDLLRSRTDIGTCYLVDAGRGRYALVAPQRQSPVRHARLRAFNDSTIRQLVGLGLIEITREWTEIAGGYDGRKRLDSRDGQVVTLTDAGRAAAVPGTGSDGA